MIKKKEVEFKLFAPEAKKVYISGSFNDWKKAAKSLRKDSKGVWKTKVELKPGKYEYKFLVDGNWWNDPSCNSCVPNSFGTQNCIIHVG